jgi:polysaccharide pyruvyl transferase WcaK-like protein
MAKHVIISGCYGISSAGDDAALLAITRLLRETLPEAVRFTVLVRHIDPEYGRAYGVELQPNLEHSSRAASQGRFLRGFNPDDPPAEIERLLRLFESAHLLILGAGNFINENSAGLMRGMLARFYLKTWLAEWVGLPVMLYGLSAAPLSSLYARRAAQWMLHHARAVTFRESVSPAVLRDCGVALPPFTTLPDPVLAMPQAPQGRETEMLRREGIPAPAGQRLALALRPTNWGDPERETAYLSLMAACMRRWLSAHPARSVITIPHCTYSVDGALSDDRAVARQAVEMLDPLSRQRVFMVKGAYLPPDTECFFRGCALALTIRLHATVFALRCGVPTVPVVYEPKVQGLLDMIGYPEDWRFLPTMAPEELEKRLDRVLAAPPGVIRSVRQRIAQCAREVGRYADIALAVMR